MSEQKWVCSSLRNLQQQLRERGHSIAHVTVGVLLRWMDYSLRVNLKKKEGKEHPDRDTQFCLIKQQRKAFAEAGIPVISVDTKKKDLIGDFKNAGRAWRREAEAVNTHDFPQDSLGRAVPYGIYDIKNNHGFVLVGNSADTSEFAVDAITAWWQAYGKAEYPHAEKLAILADAGGSNSCRYRLWKQQLQEKLCDGLGLEVSVLHYPTSCSKWNPVEHRLFGPISSNWAGEPLRSWQIMVNLIRGTKTKTGLKVDAHLHDKVYQKQIKVSDEEMASLNITHHEVCPAWNYTIRPRYLRNSFPPSVLV